jgi:hypothetical protein
LFFVYGIICEVGRKAAELLLETHIQRSDELLNKASVSGLMMSISINQAGL